ncbi:MAG TPA: type III-A CRISPR-associated protein Csm2 [Chthonomonadales bacterium]|nr:type III-A CRISPR-associated protein Csm2 [Chthonomonadales bacterium]
MGGQRGYSGHGERGHRGGGGPGGGSAAVKLSVQEEEQIRKAIGGDVALLVSLAEGLGPRLSEGRLTTSQIRSVYGMVKKMELKGYELSKDDLVLLKPKLAYAARRRDDDGPKRLQAVLTYAIDCVLAKAAEAAFERFVDFFEAIVAYHQAAVEK